MRIIRDEKSKTITLLPMEIEEAETLKLIAEKGKPGEQLRYGGCSSDDPEYKFCIVYLYFGSERKDVVKEETANFKLVHRGANVGGIQFALRGTTEQDKYEINGIRNTCYFGSGGLIYLGKVEVDGKVGIVCTAKYCSKCGATMLGRLECEWNICDDCAKKCRHAYERGAIFGPGVDIGMGEFCGKCGRARKRGGTVKKDRAKSTTEQHVAVQKELGIPIIYKNTFLTPDQLLYLEKLAKSAGS